MQKKNTLNISNFCLWAICECVCVFPFIWLI